jgi:hypothetical protein
MGSDIVSVFIKAFPSGEGVGRACVAVWLRSKPRTTDEENGRRFCFNFFLLIRLAFGNPPSPLGKAFL